MLICDSSDIIYILMFSLPSSFPFSLKAWSPGLNILLFLAIVIMIPLSYCFPFLCIVSNNHLNNIWLYGQDLEQLMREVQEARRIKMLHQPSKVYIERMPLFCLSIICSFFFFGRVCKSILTIQNIINLFFLKKYTL